MSNLPLFPCQYNLSPELRAHSCSRSEATPAVKVCAERGGVCFGFNIHCLVFWQFVTDFHKCGCGRLVLVASGKQGLLQIEFQHL